MSAEFILSIKQLLSQQISVGLGSLGSLEWVRTPAKLEVVEKKILPPSYHIELSQVNTAPFSTQFVEKFSKHAQLSSEEAVLELQKIVDAIQEEIEQKGEYQLATLGSLKKGEDNQLQFFPEEDQFWAINPAHGLTELVAEPILRSKDYLAKLAKPIIISKKLKSKKKVLLIVGASVLGLGLISIPFWYYLFADSNSIAKKNLLAVEDTELSIIPTIVDSQDKLFNLIVAYRKNLAETKLSGFENNTTTTSEEPSNPIASVKEVQKEVVPEKKSETKPVHHGPSLFEIALKAEAERLKKEATLAKTTEPQKKENQFSTSATEPTAYSNSTTVVVAGVFVEEGNAQKRLNQLIDKGFEAEIRISYSGFHRVNALLDNTDKQAYYKSIQKLRQEITEDIWIPKK